MMCHASLEAGCTGPARNYIVQGNVILPVCLYHSEVALDLGVPEDAIWTLPSERKSPEGDVAQ